MYIYNINGCLHQSNTRYNETLHYHYLIYLHVFKGNAIKRDRRFKKPLYRLKPGGTSHKRIQPPPYRKSFHRKTVLLLRRLPETHGIGNIPVSLTSPQRITIDKTIMPRRWHQRKWVQRTPTIDVRKGPGVLSGKAEKNLALPGPNLPKKGVRIHLHLPGQRFLA